MMYFGERDREVVAPTEAFRAVLACPPNLDCGNPEFALRPAIVQASQETSSRLLVWDELETEVFRGGV